MSRARLAIAGGGPVGLAVACAARDFEGVVVDAAAPAASVPGDEWDLRIFALSPGSKGLLRDLDAWDRMESRRIAPVRGMEVFGDDGARLRFAAPARDSLAWIVEAGRLSSALEGAARNRGGIDIRRGIAAREFTARAGGSAMTLADGTRIDADVLIGADGPDSAVRRALALAVEEHAYGETAIVANFETERAHGDVARQWFRIDGVLAWLPLPGRRISIVWSAPDAVARDLLALDSRALADRVRDAGGAALGDLGALGGVGRFPLRRLRVPHVVTPGAALVGDAAHGIHPLAGQGVNLGFQDVRALASVLSGRSPLERPGDLRVLRRYERARREDVATVGGLVHGLDRLFTSSRPGVPTLRNAGLRLVDSQPWARRLFAARAMR